MIPERYEPDDPREWLNRARSNLARASTRVPGVYLEDFCFDAQQAAEKAIKAVLIARRVRFPYIHDLARLIALLEENSEQIPEQIRESTRLTPYAWLSRYPGSSEQVTEAECSQAVTVAESVVRWAEERVANLGRTE